MISYDLFKNLNESESEKYKVKKQVFMDSDTNKVLKEYYEMSDNEHIIWDTDLYGWYDDEEFMQEQYQEYVDNFEPTVMSYEEFKNSSWLEDIIGDDYYSYNEFNDEDISWEDFYYGTLENEDYIQELYNDTYKPQAESQEPKSFEKWKLRQRPVCNGALLKFQDILSRRRRRQGLDYNQRVLHVAGRLGFVRRPELVHQARQDCRHAPS